METVADFISLDSKITLDGDHSHKMKRCLLLRSYKGSLMTNLNSVLNSRDISLWTKLISPSYGFSSSPLEMWTMKKAESQRIDAFELCC